MTLMELASIITRIMATAQEPDGILLRSFAFTRHRVRCAVVNMATDIPLTAAEAWDKVAEKVKRANGKWVLIADGGRVDADRAKRILARRGLEVEAVRRVGDGSKERPWTGSRTWARTI
jgi:hypothetical protein